MLDPGLLVASGGIDSTVLAYVLARHEALRGLVLIDYGQSTRVEQRDHVRFHAERLGVPWWPIVAPWPAELRYSTSNPDGEAKYIFEEGAFVGAPPPMQDPYAPLSMSAEEYDSYLKDDFGFLEGRNTAFLLFAAAKAASLGLETVYTGFQFDAPEWAAGPEGPGGCDTSPRFVRAFNALAQAGGFSRPVRVCAPFLDWRWTKPWIVQVGRLLGAPLDRTISCEFNPVCGGCRQCLVRERVLARSGLTG